MRLNYWNQTFHFNKINSLHCTECQAITLSLNFNDATCVIPPRMDDPVPESWMLSLIINESKKCTSDCRVKVSKSTNLLNSLFFTVFFKFKVWFADCLMQQLVHQHDANRNYAVWPICLIVPWRGVDVFLLCITAWVWLWVAVKNTCQKLVSAINCDPTASETSLWLNKMYVTICTQW